jgi:opacity protein-like surface antigen
MKNTFAIAALSAFLGCLASAGPTSSGKNVQTGKTVLTGEDVDPGTGRWYVSGFGGWSWTGDLAIHHPSQPPLFGGNAFDETFTLGDGWMAGSALGFQFPDNRWGGFRLEVEGSYRESSPGDALAFTFLNRGRAGVTGTDPVLAGSLETPSVMFNAIQDFDVGWDRLRPYLGGGIGASFAEIGITYLTTASASPRRHLHGSDTLFSWQFMAGLEWALTERLFTFGEYRVSGSAGMDDLLRNAVGIGLSNVTMDDFPVSQHLNLGFRVLF